MNARRAIGGALVASPFAAFYGGALWAAWGTPIVWSLVVPVIVAGMIWLGVHLLMTEPKPKPSTSQPFVPEGETGQFIERGERG